MVSDHDATLRLLALLSQKALDKGNVLIGLNNSSAWEFRVFLLLPLSIFLLLFFLGEGNSLSALLTTEFIIIPLL